MKKNVLKFKHLNSKGFVALFTVLLASVILAMAVGIANISLKQVVLSGSATDANKSFYAADSGVECALYNDIRLSSFVNTALSINCAGNNSVAVDYTNPLMPYFELEFLSDDVFSCAKVSVDKTTTPGRTKIISKGTNNACDISDSRTVERVIEVTY